jgi:hypothetical protein
MKPTVIGDGDGRLLWTGAIRPGRMHDVSALRTEGIEDLLRSRPDVRARVDSGYRGLARDFPGQVIAPPKKPGKDATAAEAAAYEQARHTARSTLWPFPLAASAWPAGSGLAGTGSRGQLPGPAPDRPHGAGSASTVF